MMKSSIRYGSIAKFIYAGNKNEYVGMLLKRIIEEPSNKDLKIVLHINGRRECQKFTEAMNFFNHNGFIVTRDFIDGPCAIMAFDVEVSIMVPIMDLGWWEDRGQQFFRKNIYPELFCVHTWEDAIGDNYA